VSFKHFYHVSYFHVRGVEKQGKKMLSSDCASVFQAVIRGTPVFHGGSPGGPRRLAGRFGRKSATKIIPDT
jgi:hypothetical protein